MLATASVPYAIFLVEDHPVMRQAYTATIDFEPDLTLCGSASSAEAARAALAAAPAPVCDLVVTDYRLPGQSGVDLVRWLVAERPGLPAVVISAYEEAAFAREAERAGAAAFLTKRDLHRTLVPAIRRVLTGDSAADEVGETQ